MRQRLETNRTVTKLSQPQSESINEGFLQGLDSFLRFLFYSSSSLSSMTPPPLCVLPLCAPLSVTPPLRSTALLRLSLILPFWTVCLKEELSCLGASTWSGLCPCVLRMWITPLCLCVHLCFCLSSQEPGHFSSPARTFTLMLSLSNTCKTQTHPPPTALPIAPLPDPSTYFACLDFLSIVLLYTLVRNLAPVPPYPLPSKHSIITEFCIK